MKIKKIFIPIFLLLFIFITAFAIYLKTEDFRNEKKCPGVWTDYWEVRGILSPEKREEKHCMSKLKYCYMLISDCPEDVCIYTPGKSVDIDGMLFDYFPNCTPKE